MTMTQSSKKRLVEAAVTAARVFIGKSRYIFYFFPCRKISTKTTPPRTKINFEF